MANILTQKLTSRKFWAAVIAAALATLLSLFGEQMEPSLLEAVASAVKVLIAYICGESAVDITRQIASAFGKNGTETAVPKTDTEAAEI